MRSHAFVVATLALAGLVAAPRDAAAQINARILVDIPILGNARAPVVVHRAPVRERVIVVHDYNPRRHGHWKREARHWRPVVLYVHGGRYYDRPIRGARQVTVYRYRDQIFHAPRDRDWDRRVVRYDRDDRWDDRWDDDRWDDDRRRDRRDPRYDDRARRRN